MKNSATILQEALDQLGLELKWSQKLRLLKAMEEYKNQAEVPTLERQETKSQKTVREIRENVQKIETLKKEIIAGNEEYAKLLAKCKALEAEIDPPTLGRQPMTWAQRLRDFCNIETKHI